MKLTYGDAQQFRDIFTTVSGFIDEGNIVVNSKGLSLKEATRDAVCFLELNINDYAFEKLETEEEKIGVNIKQLLNMLKKADKDDKVMLENTDGKLIITLSGELQRVFRIPILELDSELLPIADLEFIAKARTMIGVLDKVIKDAKTLGDSVTIEVNGGLNFSANGDVSDYNLKLINGDRNLIDFSGVGKSKYPIDYLEKLVSKSKKLFDSVTINLGDDYPIKLEHNYGDKFSLGVIIAPRVEIE